MQYFRAAKYTLGLWIDIANSYQINSLYLDIQWIIFLNIVWTTVA